MPVGIELFGMVLFQLDSAGGFAITPAVALMNTLDASKAETPIQLGASAIPKSKLLASVSAVGTAVLSPKYPYQLPSVP
jgi:hypothetical protein